MSRFRERLMRAEARINRAFAEEMPAILFIGDEQRPVIIIFESPDAPVGVPGGGEIQDHAPAFSALTHDLTGLSKHDGVLIDGVSYRVTHVGADADGRKRVTLAYGRPDKPQPAIDSWS